MVKSKGAALIVQQFSSLDTKIKIFGRQLLVAKVPINEEESSEVKPCFLIIMPNSGLKTFWNVLIIAMLIYTATYVPYRVAFVESRGSAGFQAFEYTIDALFFVDIVINFIAATEKKDRSVEIRPRQIAKNYAKTWFLFDLVATFPTNAFES